MNIVLPLIHRRCHHVIFMPVCLLMLCILWPGYAAAHRVTVFAWAEGDTVHTESKFSGGKPVNGGEIIVYDLNGNTLLSGKTNEQGEFSFKIPKRTGMKIVIQAGMGHRGEWLLSEDEIAPDETKAEAAVSQESSPGTSEAQATPSAVSLDQVRDVLNQSLDQKLSPVLKMLAESHDKGPTLRDILGGIGYIFGLMGVAAYIQFRRERGEGTKREKG